MRELQEQEKRDNVQSLFDVNGIPSDNQIRNIIDEIEPSAISPVFNDTLKVTQHSGVIDEYRVLDGGVLMPLDGVWYFHSQNIYCDHCLTKVISDRKSADKHGEEHTEYYHAAVAGAIVKPGCTKVLPVAPEQK